MKSRLFNISAFIISLIILCILFIYNMQTGHADIPLIEIFRFINPFTNSSHEYTMLLKEFRFPRAAISILAGASLSVAGLMMQSIFRNPLAGPYVLGISSGASLGVAILVLGSGTIFSSQLNYLSGTAIITAASIGAGLIMMIIVLVSMRLSDIMSILIIGILIAGIVGAIVSLLQYFAEDANVKSFVVWTMGSLSAVSSNDIKIVSPVVAFALFISFFLSKNLNLILPGDDFAISMGVNVQLVRIIVFIIVSILAGSVTAFCGPLGFIGIAVPHVSRWIFNSSNHFILMPACIIIGACFMLTGDILTHVIPNQGVLPINAVTALIGAPFVVWIVVKNKKSMV